MMNIEHLRKQAKTLVKLFPELADKHGQTLTLAGAQRIIAQLNGYPSWEGMKGVADRIQTTSLRSKGDLQAPRVRALREMLRSTHPCAESLQEQLRLASMVSQKVEEICDDDFEMALRDDWTMFAVVLIPLICALEQFHLEFARTDRMRSIVATTLHDAPSRQTNYATGLNLRKVSWQLDYATDRDRLISKGLLESTGTE